MERVEVTVAASVDEREAVFGRVEAGDGEHWFAEHRGPVGGELEPPLLVEATAAAGDVGHASQLSVFAFQAAPEQRTLAHNQRAVGVPLEPAPRGTVGVHSEPL